MKSLCAFCMKEHKSRVPKICEAKGRIMTELCKNVPKGDEWTVLVAVEQGLIDLEAEARKAIRKGK